MKIQVKQLIALVLLLAGMVVILSLMPERGVNTQTQANAATKAIRPL